MLKNIILTSLFLVVATCVQAKNNQQIKPAEDNNKPIIIETLDKKIGDFAYAGFQKYSADLGHSIRYADSKDQRNYGDIYVWPVQSANRSISQKNLVDQSAQMALSNIYTIQKKGHYSDVKELNQQSKTIAGNYTKMYKLSYVAGGKGVLSYLYISAHNGNYLKTRFTVQDNTKLSDNDIDNFVVQIFCQLVKN